MTKRIQKFMKYSQTELESYANTKGSCIKKVNTNMHVSLGPYCLKNFKQSLVAHLARKKIGFYDVHLNGIILDIKNIKVLSDKANMRAENPNIHFDINVNCYIFCPEVGSELSGIVKHIGSHNVGVILYRVFNANIRFKDKLNINLEIDQKVNFCVRNYDLQNIFPYIDGDRLTLVDGSNGVNMTLSKYPIKIKEEVEKEEMKNRIITFKVEEESDME